MAKLLDPQDLPAQKTPLPAMRPPVKDFAPADDGDPSEVDTFNQMIRELRDHGSPLRRPEMKALRLETNAIP
jgi:hypothetical protein